LPALKYLRLSVRYYPIARTANRYRNA